MFHYFIRATNFVVRVSPTLCVQYITNSNNFVQDDQLHQNQRRTKSKPQLQKPVDNGGDNDDVDKDAAKPVENRKVVNEETGVDLKEVEDEHARRYHHLI